MSVYKYMAAEGGLRLLRTSQIRITPPAQFNDPFELRPPVAAMVTEEYMDVLIAEGAPSTAIAELATQLTPRFGSFLSSNEVRELASSFINPLGASAQKSLVRKIRRGIPQFSAAKLTELQKLSRAQFPILLQQGRAQMAQPVAMMNAMLKRGFSETLPSALGVLCLTRDSNQALMWAHYADSHKGLLIEFDDAHATFNRRRSDQDEFGYLRPVAYSKVRPELNMKVVDADEVFDVFALTKAHQWAYEKEVRLIWPLRDADRTTDTAAGVISLLACPASAIKSVTLGCKASDETVSAVRDLLRSRDDMAHVKLRKARLHEIAFELIYDELSASE
jgi:hypothetical protein